MDIHVRDQYLITYTTLHFRDGTAHLTYHVEQPDGTKQPLVKVSQSGHLVAGSHTGHATLLVTADEDFEINQTVIVLVKVRILNLVLGLCNIIVFLVQC